MIRAECGIVYVGWELRGDELTWRSSVGALLHYSHPLLIFPKDKWWRRKNKLAVWILRQTSLSLDFVCTSEIWICQLSAWDILICTLSGYSVLFITKFSNRFRYWNAKGDLMSPSVDSYREPVRENIFNIIYTYCLDTVKIFMFGLVSTSVSIIRIILILNYNKRLVFYLF